jgi:glycine cleavage system H lipoate-binding protein
LTSLTSEWTAEYGKLYPAVNISISGALTEQSIPQNKLCLITGEQAKSITDGTYWKMVIGRSAVVPVYNKNNPLLSDLLKVGVSSEKLKQFFTDPQSSTWGTLLNTESGEALNFYYTGNNDIMTALTRFINSESSLISGIMVGSEEELLAAIQNDIYAVGFCNLSNIKKAETEGLMGNISLLPIDKNGNGRLDSFENIYTDLNTLSRGVWIGKFPSALCSNLYAVSTAKPTGEPEVGFLTWIMNDGQELLNANGYSTLATSESSANTDALWSNKTDLEAAANEHTSSLWLIIIGALVITGIVVTVIYRMSSRKNTAASDKKILITNSLDESSIKAPNGLYFDKSHTWAFMEKDGVVRIGVDDFLQHITGTITRVKMKETGDSVRKGEVILTLIKDGKQLNIYAPVTGTIKEYNTALSNDSSLLNSSPFTEGWVYIIEPKNWIREIEFMFMGDRYKDWLSDEFSRLRDFFAASVRTNSSAYAHIILQDGGELTDNVLAELEPQVWEDFQTRFLDNSK